MVHSYCAVPEIIHYPHLERIGIPWGAWAGGPLNTKTLIKERYEALIIRISRGVGALRQSPLWGR